MTMSVRIDSGEILGLITKRQTCKLHVILCIAIYQNFERVKRLILMNTSTILNGCYFKITLNPASVQFY